ncbi:MAG: hypothetical protein LUD83_05535 [Clostridiales bacterium]|nr:hypothetical protein [Clostridiales bacterium]
MKVYLYELDSVRNSPAEIELAQKRLFEEIVGNGNTVVLSLNQLLDGMGFTGALYGDKGDENYQTILKLFQSGLVKVCKFTDPDTKETIETLEKYWLKNMKKEQFIVSGKEVSAERKADMEAILTGERNIAILDIWVNKGNKKEKADAQYLRRVIRLIYELGMYDIWVEEERGDIKGTFERMLKYILHPTSMSKKAQEKYSELKTAYPKIQCAVDLLL